MMGFNIFGNEPPCSVAVQRKKCTESRIDEQILSVILELLRASHRYLQILVTL
jgi:hypothetical protein